MNSVYNLELNCSLLLCLSVFKTGNKYLDLRNLDPNIFQDIKGIMHVFQMGSESNKGRSLISQKYRCSNKGPMI